MYFKREWQKPSAPVATGAECATQRGCNLCAPNRSDYSNMYLPYILARYDCALHVRYPVAGVLYCIDIIVFVYDSTSIRRRIMDQLPTQATLSRTGRRHGTVATRAGARVNDARGNCALAAGRARARSISRPIFCIHENTSWYAVMLHGASYCCAVHEIPAFICEVLRQGLRG